MESYKEYCFRAAARKGHSEEVTFEQGPEWREEGSHDTGRVEKALSRWTDRATTKAARDCG